MHKIRYTQNKGVEILFLHLAEVYTSQVILGSGVDCRSDHTIICLCFCNVVYRSVTCMAVEYGHKIVFLYLSRCCHLYVRSVGMSFLLFFNQYFSFQQENAPDMVYLGSLTNFDLIYAWTQDKCVPLVREITFENGEVRIFSTFLLLGSSSQN